MSRNERHLLTKSIVLVDDEPELLHMVSEILTREGFESLHAFTSPTEALTFCRASAANSESIGLVILDVMMPEMDGNALLSYIRCIATLEHVPAIFLTAKDAPQDRIAGLGLGADDYIAKPFLPQELVLRIMAVLRRCYAEDDPTLDLGYCSVNFDTAEVTRPDGVVMLTAKEHDILRVLAQNRGRIVTIDALCQACWEDPFGYENTLMAHIHRLREKIEQDPAHPQALVTVKGLGYKLIAQG
jgi:DNA-binding response OmpR family regulator